LHDVTSRRFICPGCLHRAGVLGVCESCDGGLERVDLAMAEVRERLLTLARGREEARRKKLIWRIEIGVIAGAFAVLAMGLLLAGLFASTGLYVVAKVVALIALTLGWGAIGRIYERVPRTEPLFVLTRDEVEAFEKLEN
jgi:hypothetical protein